MVEFTTQFGTEVYQNISLQYTSMLVLHIVENSEITNLGPGNKARLAYIRCYIKPTVQAPARTFCF